MGIEIITGDCRDVLRQMPDGSVHCCVTSPPYFGLRDYGVDGQIGLEQTPDAFVAELVAVFREVRRVLRDDGTLWLNLGDSYASGGGVAQPHRDSSGGIGKKGTRGQQGFHAAGGGFVRPNTLAVGLKPKDLIGIPWLVAFALRADGWYLRQEIIWHKPNPMPESVTDRCTKAHEQIFLLSKSPRYWFDAAAIAEPVEKGWAGSEFNTGKTGAHQLGRAQAGERSASGAETRNKRSVWTVTTQPFSEAHFATFPPALIEPCILAGCPIGGTVLDPFGGAGTTGLVAQDLGRNAILIELNPEYAAIADRRLKQADVGLPLIGSAR